MIETYNKNETLQGILINGGEHWMIVKPGIGLGLLEVEADSGVLPESKLNHQGVGKPQSCDRQSQGQGERK